jgi:hypothetical protein
MTNDSGLAPNPFHGVCTLAVCTPNHVRANLEKGDYIVGVAGVDLCNKLKLPSESWGLIYAMKVDKVMMLDAYYNSADYRLKIPKLDSSKVNMSGDNFYKKHATGNLVHTGESIAHGRPEIIKQDCAGNRVFIGKTYNYFGSFAPKIPQTSSWGNKLIHQLTKRPVHITYILGGKCKNPWTVKDFEEFMKFLDKNKIDHIPDPIDFDNWTCEVYKKSSCHGCS